MPISAEKYKERLEWFRRWNYGDGESFEAIARTAGVHRTTVSRSCYAIMEMDGVEIPRNTFYANGGHIDEYNDVIARLNASKRYLCGVIGSDQHFVDHDPTAILLERQIIRSVKPDFHVSNGDTLDFAAVSKFLLSRREPKGDILRTVEPFWKRYTEDKLDVRSDMDMIHNSGNHNLRLERFLTENWQVAETVEDAYRDLIRQDGAVVMHDFVEDCIIGPLMIQHGERTNEHSYKSQLEDVAYGMDVASGHKHTPGVYYRRQLRGYNRPIKVITSAVAGCLCRLIPKYAEHRTKNPAKWINSILVVNVNPALDDAHIEPVIFHPLEDGMYASFGGNIFYQPYVDPEQLEWWS